MKTLNVGRLMVWAFALAMPFWLSSCKKDNAGGGEPITPNSIEGSWKISGMKMSDGKETVDFLEMIKELLGEDAVACLTDITITFNSTGKVTGKDSPKCQSGEADGYNPVGEEAIWKVTGNKLTITSGSDVSTYDLTVTGNTMTWSIQEQDDLDEDGKKETYTRTIEFKRV
jgi:hypothetical protein